MSWFEIIIVTMVNQHSATVGVFFDQATDVFRQISHSHFINLGFWEKRTRLIATAQRRLVLEFGRFSNLSPNLRILDVGCGTGAQDLLWMDVFDPALIHGINVSRQQVEFARAMVGNSCYAKRLVYDVGDASQLSDDLCGFHRVVALECAHLFPDIPGFFQSAHKGLLLRGTLSLANLTYIDESAFSDDVIQSVDSELRGMGFDFHPYVVEMMRLEHLRAMFFKEMLLAAEKAGFSVGRVEDITIKVAPFYGAFMKRTLELLKTSHDQGEIQGLVACALSFVTRRYQFENGSVRYHFLELIK